MSESTDNNTRDLASAERAAGSKIYIGGAKFLLPIALVLFLSLIHI